MLGGGTRNGFLSDSILQLSSIPLLLLSLWRMLDLRASPELRRVWLFCFLVVLVPLLQLVPLPPAIWMALPHREPLAETFDLLGRPPPWMPISILPRDTYLSVLSLMPPLAIFLSALFLSHRERGLLSLTMLALGIISVFVGLLQVAQGPSSPLRFFEFTNLTEAVGFFANRNHFAALLYSLVPFAAAWTVATANPGPGGQRQGYDTTYIIALLAGFTVIVILIVGQVMARSRAGLGLQILALFGAFAMAISDRRIASARTSTRLLLGATVLALTFAVQFALYRILDRFTSDPLSDARIVFVRNTIEAAKAYMPFGSGVGTFASVYPMFEAPQDLLANAYVNRAHNDILELWLETGVAGIGLMALFALWLTLKLLKIWRHAPLADNPGHLLPRAATFVIVLVIAHSFVDYPLRTGAMMAVMAFSCALLIDPVVSERETSPCQSPKGESVHVSEASLPTHSQRADAPSGPSTIEPLPRSKRWGEGIEWPEEWRTSPGQHTTKSPTNTRGRQ